MKWVILHISLPQDRHCVLSSQTTCLPLFWLLPCPSHNARQTSLSEFLYRPLGTVHAWISLPCTREVTPENAVCLCLCFMEAQFSYVLRNLLPHSTKITLLKFTSGHLIVRAALLSLPFLQHLTLLMDPFSLKCSSLAFSGITLVWPSYFTSCYFSLPFLGSFPTSPQS